MVTIYFPAGQIERTDYPSTRARMPLFEQAVDSGKARARAESISLFDVEASSRRDLPGKLTFEEYAGDFIDIQRTAADLAAADWEEIPAPILMEIQPALESLEAVLLRIRQLDPIEWATGSRGGDLTSERDQYVKELRSASDAFFQAAAKVSAFSGNSRFRRGQSELDVRIGEEMSAIRRETGRAKADADAVAEARLQMEALVAEGRDALKQLGVGRHAAHFKTAADSHERASKWWLVATVAIGSVTVGLAWFNYYESLHSVTPLDASHTTQLIAAKVIAFSVLASVAVLCGRSYRAQKHNEVVNRHRQNALSSFETFVSAAGSDEQIKNAVLLEATRSIFAPQLTGYTHGESEGGGSSQLVEVLRTLPGGGSK